MIGRTSAAPCAFGCLRGARYTASDGRVVYMCEAKKKAGIGLLRERDRSPKKKSGKAAHSSDLILQGGGTNDRQQQQQGARGC